jgi:hypothetical protein
MLCDVPAAPTLAGGFNTTPAENPHHLALWTIESGQNASSRLTDWPIAPNAGNWVSEPQPLHLD